MTRRRQQTLGALAIITSLLPVPAGGAGTAGVEAALSRLEGVEVLRLQVPEEPGSFRAALTLEATRMTLELAPHSVRSDEFRVRVQRRDGSARLLDPGPVTTLRGTVPEIPGSRVVGSLVGGKLEALIWLPDEVVFSLEPVARYLPGADASLYALVRCGEAGVAPTGLNPACGAGLASDVVEGQALHTRGGTNGEDCAYLGLCVAELVCDTDSAVYAAFGGDEAAIIAWVEFLVAWANSRYEPDFQVRHEINLIQLRPDPDTDPYLKIGDATSLLNEVYQQWNVPYPPAHSGDLIHLFTLPAFADPGGAAWENGLCSAGVFGMQSFSRGTQSVCTRAGLLIHELGHTWGASHQPAGMMAPFNQDCDAPWAGAAQQIQDWRDLRDSQCLDLLIEADLGVSVTTVGSFQVIATVSNAGPHEDPGVQLRVTFASTAAYTVQPDASAAACVEEPPPPGFGTSKEYRCEPGSLAVGGTYAPSWSVSGSPSGPPLAVLAVVTGGAEDPVPANNQDDAEVGGDPGT